MNFRDLLSLRIYAETIVDTVSQPLVLLDPERRLLAANPACVRTFGIDGDPRDGVLLAELTQSWSADAAASLDEVISSIFLSGVDRELECALGDQANRTMIVRARRAAHGRQMVVLLAFEDVTAQRSLEHALKVAVSELERSNRDLEAFASVASHDLQEPLRKIRAFGGRLEATCGDALPAAGRQYLTRMIDAAARMQLLINDVLALARVGTQPRHLATLDLAGVADDALRDLDQLLATTGALVEIGDLPCIDANASEMRQVFQNLIANAIKFRSGAAPVIRITAMREPVADGRAAWCIVVADNGIGFDQKYAERIFRPFERLHARDAFEGSGVGLALCRRIVERHGGTIRAEAQHGVGAQFIIRLPERQQT